MGSYHNIAKYSIRHKSVILGGGNGGRQLYRLAADGSLTRLRDAPVKIGINNSVVVTTDPVSGDLLVISDSRALRALRALDVERNQWRLVARTTPIRWGKVTATPLSDHGVIMFVTLRPEKALLYKHAATPEPGSG